MLNLPRILRFLLAGIPAIQGASIAGFKRLAADLTNVGNVSMSTLFYEDLKKN
jgi:hypothetical protein